MIPIQAYLVTAHLDDLRREAAAARRAREVALAGGDTFGGASRPPRRPDVRRGLALAAVRLSVLADGAARRLDPCLEAFNDRRAAGVAGR
ncbi:MAG TPA: hypothetical protein VFP19_00865 [Candidatus Limnocylindrales bacterium]|nr:hypothetical protein [Candidatus Limnocylindrales bacterium]